jgi:hypothetical protein
VRREFFARTVDAHRESSRKKRYLLMCVIPRRHSGTAKISFGSSNLQFVSDDRVLQPPGHVGQSRESGR